VTLRRIGPLALLLCCLLAPPAAAPAGGGVVQQGKALYGQYCLSCHGANGRGISQAGKRRIGAGPLRRQAVQVGLGPSLRGVGALAADFYLTTGYMPLQHVGVQPRRSRVLLTNGEIRSLVAYVASLGSGPPIPEPQPQRGSLSQGMQLFTDHCAGCHQIAARGGYVTGAVPPPLQDATPVQIAEAVRVGPYVMPAFSAKAISDAQLDSIIRYVDYTKHPDNRGGWAIGDVGPVPEGLVAWLIGLTALIAVCVVIGERLKQDG